MVQCNLTCPQYVHTRQQLVPHSVQVGGLGYAGSAERSTVICREEQSNRSSKIRNTNNEK